MYGNKKYRNIVCWILICALAFIPVRRANAVAPAIPAAVYYAIAATGTACGIYALNKDSLDYMVSDYWNSCGEYIQRQWQWLGEYGYMVGEMTIDGALTKTVIDYLNDNFTAGENIKTEHGEQASAIEGDYYYKDNFWINGYSPTTRFEYGYISGIPDSKWFLELDGVQIFYLYSYGPSAHEITENWVKLWVEEGRLYFELSRATPNNPDWRTSGYKELSEIAALLGVSNVVLTGSTLFSYEFVGDAAGFGAALEDPPEVHIPCPPVPPAEWPDRWADDLTDGMVGEGGQVIEGPMDWFKDKDTGEIIYFPPGDPPPEYDPEKHEKLVPPVPPIYDPIHPTPGEPGPATPDSPAVPAPEPCPYCPPNPHPLNDPCPNPYCPNNPAPVSPPVPATPGQPVEPCPYCPPNPDPGLDPCPNPYCPNNPSPQAPPAIPDAPVPDDRYLDFEPLKKLPHIFTTKFPFSLPWDLKRGIESLEGGQWDRKFRIAACGNYWPEMTVDVSMFDPIAGIARVVFLLVFDFALIFATRRLMGGDV